MKRKLKFMLNSALSVILSTAITFTTVFSGGVNVYAEQIENVLEEEEIAILSGSEEDCVEEILVVDGTLKTSQMDN